MMKFSQEKKNLLFFCNKRFFVSATASFFDVATKIFTCAWQFFSKLSQETKN